MSDVANTIYSQLGGKRFAVMTGAKNFVGGENYLKFRVTKANNAINMVTITLDPTDTYTVEFGRYNASKISYRAIEKVENVYFDQLEAVFTSYTGLYTGF